MIKRILEILDNVRYWDTCPDDYKKDIEKFLNKKPSPIKEGATKSNVKKHTQQTRLAPPPPPNKPR